MPVKTLQLDGQWKLSDTEFSKGEALKFYEPRTNTAKWMDTQVPGDIHTTLIKEKRIEDPYFGKNVLDCRWTQSRDWWYRRDFTVPKSFKGEKLELVFDGIDTYATIWLNGQKLGTAANMFKQYRFDVTELVKPDGPNTLAVCINGTLPIIEGHDSSKYFACFYTPRIFARKAQCQFSWDWAPFLPSIGIWMNVRLEAQTGNKINEVFVRTKTSGDVTVHVLLDQRKLMYATDDLDQKKAAELKKKLARQKKAELDTILVEILDGKKVVAQGTIEVSGRKNFINLKVENPKLWWPNGYGAPSLYQYRVTLRQGDKALDTREGRFGIREVELVEEVLKEDRTSFTFKINGVEIYCQGANKIPDDCFPALVNKERYARILELTKDANMNMLRIWGGGMYEKDEFYELCDENGIMLWHDLMFACSDIPDDDPNFVTEVMDEFVYQLKRLRNHPSIVYWCGCNEKTGSAGEKITFGDKIYHYVGRGVVNDLMPDVPYRPASPHSFNDAGNNPNTGDTHMASWETAFTHGMHNFRKFIDQTRPVFHSEFGMHGPCQLPTIKKFIPEDELWPLNGTWFEHIHNNPYSSIPQTFMQVQFEGGEHMFHKIDSAAEFVKVAGTLHAELLRAEYENGRQQKFANAGSMVWMLNDCWPSASWSLIDYYGIPKQAFYATKRALAPVLASIRETEGKYRVFVTNDLLHDLSGTLVVEEQSVEGKKGFTKKLKVKVEANSAQMLLEFSPQDLKKLANSYLFVKFDYKGGQSRTTFFHELWKDIAWPEPKLAFVVAGKKKEGGENVLTLEFKAEKFARSVYLASPEDTNAVYSDNFFDMIPGEVKLVTIRSKKAINPKAIKVNHWLTSWE